MRRLPAFLLPMAAILWAATGHGYGAASPTPEDSGDVPTDTATAVIPDRPEDDTVAIIPFRTYLTFRGSKPDGNRSIESLPSPIDISGLDIHRAYIEFEARLPNTNNKAARTMRNGYGFLRLYGPSGQGRATLTLDLAEADWQPGLHTYRMPLQLAVPGGEGMPLAIDSIGFGIEKVHNNFTQFSVIAENFRIVNRRRPPTLPAIYGDGMMFQRGRPIVIRGHTRPLQPVEVALTLADEAVAQACDTASAAGDWKVELPAREGSMEQYTLRVAEADGTVTTVNDILIGDLWLTAGQSNMELPVRGTVQRFEMMDAASNRYVRFLYMPSFPYSGSRAGEMPRRECDDVAGAHWGRGDDAAQTGCVSAIGYIAACDMQARLGIPVGFIHAAAGGTTIESWMPSDATDSDPELRTELIRRGLLPDPDETTLTYLHTATLYNQKIAPLESLGLAGVMWYQGEANVAAPEIYAAELTAMKSAWERRLGFGSGEMPFVFCQTGRWYIEPTHPRYIAELDEAMLDAWNASGQSRASMSLLPIYDTDMSYLWNTMIHPTNKYPVGHRFATAALAFTSDSVPDAYTAPVPAEMANTGGALTIRFSHTGEGLRTTDGSDEVRGFSICDRRGVHVDATARITGPDQVEIWNPAIGVPTGFTYAYSSYNFTANLANSAGIPAAPFRSDRGDGQTYYNPQDWAYADSPLVWAVADAATAGMLPAWEGRNASVSADTIRRAGLGSLRISYDGGGSPEFGPVTDHASVRLSLSGMDCLTIGVMNPDLRRKPLTLHVLDNAGEELMTVRDMVEISDEWQDIRFRFPLWCDLKRAYRLYFSVEDGDAGSLIVDGVSFGLPDVAVRTEKIGVEEIPACGGKGQWHDTAGRPVASPSLPGVYVRKGEKIIVR